nr:hypothetical protein CFP56_25205 [Quercus suber]
MGSKWSHSKGGNKSSKWSQTKDNGGSLSSAVDDSPLRPLCDPWVTTTSPFPFPLLLDPMTPNEEKMEIGSDIVDSDEFNLPSLNGVTELRLRRQEGEAIVTLEDVEKILLLPLVGCKWPWPIVLVEGSEGIIKQLYTGYGGRDAPPCNKHSRFTAWVRYFENFKGTLVRHTAFVVHWLSHYALTESPFDHIKTYLFPLAVLLARVKSFTVGTMCLNNLYNNLDALHTSEMEGSPYYVVVTHLNLALLQVLAWERALPLVAYAHSVTVVSKLYPPSPKNN